MAQFGSIDELKRELNLTDEATGENGEALAMSANELTALREEYKVFTKNFSIAIGVGVSLCILSPVVFILLEKLSETLAIGMFLGVIAAAVFIFIIFGVKSEYYEEQLGIKKLNHEDDENDPFSGAIFLGATAIFLLLGFIGGWWHPGWLVYLLATAIVMLHKAGKKRGI